MKTFMDWKRWKKGRLAATVCGLLLTQTLVARADGDYASDGQWTMGGQNPTNSRSQDESKIRPSNASSLFLKWVFTTGDDVSATPAVANGIVYFPDYAGNFFAVNAETGALVWQHKVSDWTQVANDYARNDPLIYGNMVILGNQAGQLAKWDNTSKIFSGAGASIIAVNSKTGKLVWVSKIETYPGAIVTGSPVAHDGILYVGVSSAEETQTLSDGYPCCISRGSVVALNIQTGKKLWQTYMVPDNNGIVGGYSGGNIWGSTPVIDAKRNALYVGTGNNLSVPASVSACAKMSPNDSLCASAFDYFDSVVALDLKTGDIRWANRAMSYDAWNDSCVFVASPPGPNCPIPFGPDYDFSGAGPNLFTMAGRDMVGAGAKSGVYWALNPDNGKLVWKTQVGPGGGIGGIEWGTASDNEGIYVPIANQEGTNYMLRPSNVPANGGSWAALDPATGKVRWQIATPGGCAAQAPSGPPQACMALGPPSVAGGVVFVGSMDTNPANPTMFALDSQNGKILWSYAPGSSVNAGPAIVGDSIYWGSGWGRYGPSAGTPNTKLFAFSIHRDHTE